MLHDNINISGLMVHDQKFLEARLKKNSRDTNRVRSYDGGSSKGSLDIQDKLRF